MTMLVEKKNIDTQFGMIPDEILNYVLSMYQFDNSWLVLPFINVNKKAIAINRRSETARKAVILYKSELYILKEIPWYCSNEEFVNYEVNFQMILKENRIPIPEIIKNSNEKLYTKINLMNQEKFFFLQRYIKGSSWIGLDENLKDSAKSLARLHNASMENRNKIIREYNPPKSSVFDLADKMLKVLEEVINEKKEKISAKVLIDLQAFCSYAKEKNQWAKSFAIKKGYDEISCPIHGDFNPWNLIYDSNNSNITGIIDFDNSILDNPIHDVVEAILDFCFFKYKTQRMIFKGIPDEFNKHNAKVFFEHYINECSEGSNKFNKYISEVAVAISIELISLGLVRGDYDFDECNKIIGVVNYIEKEIINIACNV
jgi:hypothetical protein